MDQQTDVVTQHHLGALHPPPRELVLAEEDEPARTTLEHLSGQRVSDPEQPLQHVTGVQRRVAAEAQRAGQVRDQLHLRLGRGREHQPVSGCRRLGQVHQRLEGEAPSGEPAELEGERQVSPRRALPGASLTSALPHAAVPPCERDRRGLGDPIARLAPSATAAPGSLDAGHGRWDIQPSSTRTSSEGATSAPGAKPYWRKNSLSRSRSALRTSAWDIVRPTKRWVSAKAVGSPRCPSSSTNQRLCSLQSISATRR